MKYVVKIRKNNTKNQKPQTNTLNTKTIRTKNWRKSLLFVKQTPATIGIVVGFLLATGIPTTNVLFSQHSAEPPILDDIQDSFIKGTSLSNHTAETPYSAINQRANSEEVEESFNSAPDRKSSSITVQVKLYSKDSPSSLDSHTVPEGMITVNDKRVELPKSGTYRESIKKEGSKLNIRLRNGTTKSNVSIKANLSINGGNL